MNDIFDEAKKAFQDKRFKKALELLILALIEKPNNPQIIQELSRTYYHLGMYEQAEIEARRALELQANLAIPHLVLGFIFGHRNEHDVATKQVKKAVELDPNLIEGYSNLAILLSRQGKTEEGVIYLLKALDFSPNDWRLHFALSLLYREQARRPDCLREMRTAFSYYPSTYVGSQLFLLFLDEHRTWINMGIFVLVIIGLILPNSIAFPFLSIAAVYGVTVGIASLFVGDRKNALIFLSSSILLLAYYIFRWINI